MSGHDVARGIDHIGLTVTDIEAADRFLVDGLGAEFIYEMLGSDRQPLSGAELERAIGLPRGTTLHVVRMYRLGTGPGIELFQYRAEGQRDAARACDAGWQHVALYVDDIEAAVSRCVAAGGELLSPPWSLVGAEGGEGNLFCFVRTPFGALVELITYPSAQPYEDGTALRRWRPPTGG